MYAGWRARAAGPGIRSSAEVGTKAGDSLKWASEKGMGH